MDENKMHTEFRSITTPEIGVFQLCCSVLELARLDLLKCIGKEYRGIPLSTDEQRTKIECENFLFRGYDGNIPYMVLKSIKEEYPEYSPEGGIK